MVFKVSGLVLELIHLVWKTGFGVFLIAVLTSRLLQELVHQKAYRTNNSTKGLKYPYMSVPIPIGWAPYSEPENATLRSMGITPSAAVVVKDPIIFPLRACDMLPPPPKAVRKKNLNFFFVARPLTKDLSSFCLSCEHFEPQIWKKGNKFFSTYLRSALGGG